MQIRTLVPVLAVALAALGGSTGCTAQKQEAQETKAAQHEPESAPSEASSQAAGSTQQIVESAQRGAAAEVVEGIDTDAEQVAGAVEKRGVAGAAAEAAGTLEHNVEHSADVAQETYEKKRESGTKPVGAAGQAYEAVIDTGEQAKTGEKTATSQAQGDETSGGTASAAPPEASDPQP